MREVLTAKDIAPRRQPSYQHRRMVVFDPRSLAQVDELVQQARARGDRNANRSQQVRHALQARQRLREALREPIHGLTLLLDLMTSNACTGPEAIKWLGDVRASLQELAA